MGTLISIRDTFSRLYGQHDTLVRMMLKFLMALATFTLINLILGQMPIVNNPFIVIGLAFLCAFLPSNSMLLLGMLMVLFHFYGISLEAALAGGAMLAILMLLYFSIAPRTAFPLILGAIAAGIKVPGVIAIMCGLVGGPLSAIGVGFGVLISYLIRIVSSMGGHLTATSSDAADALMEKMLMLITEVIGNREMILSAILCVMALWLVCILKQIPVRYGWVIAAIVGILVYAGGRFGGMVLLGIPVDYIFLGIEGSTSLILAWMAQNMLFNLDFKKTESVHFEDDEYFYYVKAVPKRKIIRTRRLRRSERR